jgi:hypothetical protein
MAASFPNTKKTFTAVVNGVTKLIATLFNSPYDEIEAIETMLGAMGSTQAYCDSYKNMLKTYRSGCDVEYKAAGEIYVRSGEICIVDASGNARFRVNPSDTTVTWAMIDTGAEASSTQYYVYACADASGTTFTIKISTNATTPTGATFYRKIGRFYNNSSGNIDISTVATLNREKISGEKIKVKAWVVFVGTGTIAISDGVNIAGITDNGTGDYTVTWDTDFASANYCVIASSDTAGPVRLTTLASDSVRIKTVDSAANATDAAVVCVAALGA